MTPCLSFHLHHILWHFCSGKQRNHNKFWGSFWTRKWPTSLGYSFFQIIFFPSFFSFLYIFLLLQWLTFYWACVPITTRNVCHGVTMCSGRTFCSEFFKFLNIFVHIVGFTELITLIWVSLEQSKNVDQNFNTKTKYDKSRLKYIFTQWLPRGCFLEKLRYHLCSRALSLSGSCRGNIWVTTPLDIHLGT